MGSEIKVTNIQWINLGFTAGEQEMLDSFQRNVDSFPFTAEMATWQQWVTEIERGELHTADELESAYAARDDVEDSCAVIDPTLRDRLYSYLDGLDSRYRNSTVSGGNFGGAVPPVGHWWRGRVPVRNRARAYLLEDMN